MKAARGDRGNASANGWYRACQHREPSQPKGPAKPLVAPSRSLVRRHFATSRRSALVAPCHSLGRLRRGSGPSRTAPEVIGNRTSAADQASPTSMSSRNSTPEKPSKEIRRVSQTTSFGPRRTKSSPKRS